WRAHGSWIAASLLARGLHDRAVWCLREAARLDPELPGVQARLAEAYWQTGRHERARQLFLIELREDPGDVGVLMNLGRLLVEMRRLDEAREKFGRVLELEPDHAEAHAELGFLHEKRSDSGKAVVHLDVARRLQPENGEVTRRLARLLLGSSKVEDRQRTVELLEAEVERLYRAAEREGSEEFVIDPAALAELGELLIDAGAQTQAIRVLNRAVRMRPSEARLWHWLGLAHFHAGDRSSGIEATREAVRLDPRFVPAMHNIALALLREGQWSRARYWLKQGISVDPEDASLRRLDVQLRLHRLGWSVRWIASVWLLRRRPSIPA
ncbi:MAG: tetratricopeptide repeat protein, partial [Planctomycetota bacterium]